MYRQHLGELAIEEGTDRVPSDGRYHVIQNGIVRKSFKTLRGALVFYATLKVPAAPVGSDLEG